MSASLMEVPFLYHTKTILRLGRVSGTALSGTFRHTHRRSSSRNAITHQDRDVDWKQEYFKRQAERRKRVENGQPEPEVAKEEQLPTSTITGAEQRAFARLHDLATHQQHADQPLERLSTDPDKILALFPGPPQRRKERNVALADQDKGQAVSGQYDPFQSSSKFLAWQGPQHLDDISINRPLNSEENLVTKVCQHQLSSYHKAFLYTLKLKDYPRDLAIFDILMSRIFPLVDLVTPATTSSVPHSPSSPSTSEPSSTLKEAKVPKPTNAILPLHNIVSTILPSVKNLPKVTPLSVVSRLYPAAVLLALRLLTKHQPLSPITSSLLSEVRRVGATSYILAGNTHFYNTFLLLRWNLYSSSSEICGILNEMERGAVQFDQGTSRFLAEMAEERARDLYISTLPTSKAEPDETEVRRSARWWQKSEQVKWWPRIMEWRGVIAQRLEERGVGEVIREGPYSSLLAEEALSGSREGVGKQVWL